MLVLAWAALLSACDRDTETVELLDGVEGTEDVALRGESRRAASAALPSVRAFALDLPRHAELAFSAALVAERRVPRAKVEFRIDLFSGGRTVELFRRNVDVDEENRWLDTRIDLSAWSGKSVELLFSTEPSRATAEVYAPPWVSRVRPVWGDPRIRSREATPLRPGERPSLVLILVDTLRPDFLGAYGFAGPISPNLDRLAAESLLFENCFANAPWTKPSIATLFTSLPPAVHGVTDMGRASWSGEGGLMQVLPEEAVTLAELLRSAGYRTGAFVGNAFVSPRHGFSQGFEVFERRTRTDELLSAARKWLAGLGESGETPFFLYLHAMDVHGPYDAPREDYEAVLLMEEGVSRRLTEEEHAQLPGYLRETVWVSEEEPHLLRSWRSKYGGGVRFFDRTIGPFLDELRGSGALDRAYLVLTADHGEELLEHGGWNHGNNLYDHQLHVPLLVRKPLAKDAGRRISPLVSLVDLMPTLLSAAGIEAPPGILGRDFSALVRGEPWSETEAVFASAVNGHPRIQSVRTRSHKLVWNGDGVAVELYDLGADPMECRDVSEEERAALARMEAALREHLERNESRGTLTPAEAPLDDEIRERLKALGYVP